jgi:hypothetical protein
MFPTRKGLKLGDALEPFLCIFAVEYAIRSVRVSQDGVSLNGTYQTLVYADYVNILRGIVHTIKKTIEALLVSSKEIGPEVNGDTTKYMVMSRGQNAGRSHIIKAE